MSQPEKPNKRWFSGSKISFANTNVDAEAGIIRNVILCQVGPAKGHGVHLEQSFIDDLNAYAQKHHQKGMKSRFGHPSMSTDALGSEVGRFHNFSVDGSKIRADLHLYNSANLSPTHPQTKDWLLSMAAEDPEAIMCSIVFKPKYEYQYDDNGERIDIWFCDKRGNWKRCSNTHGEANKYDPNKDLYVELDDFYFTDIVDQGAATDKLFSAQFNRDKFAVIATEFLNDNPEIDSFLKDHPEKISEFITKRNNNYSEGDESIEDTNSPNTNMKIDMSKYPTFTALLGIEAENKGLLASLFSKSEDNVSLSAEQLEIVENALAEGSTNKQQVGTLSTEKTNLETQLSDEKQKVTDLTSEKTNLENENKLLKAAHVPAPGAAANAEDGTTGGESDNEFYSEADAELDAILNPNSK